MLLDRHRIARLIELADLERRVTGPERALREEDVALLIKAAYDDATEAARAAFMARVQAMPVTAWPWSAVQVKYVRAPSTSTATGGGRMVVGFSPAPTAVIPPVLLLIRGQADSADTEPGNRLPDRGAPESELWEPLYKALDGWDTQNITRWIGPQGWVRPGNGQAQPAPSADNGATSGPPAGSMVPPTNGAAPEPQPPSASPWRSPTAIAIGTTVASTLGVVLFTLRRRRTPAIAQQEAS